MRGMLSHALRAKGGAAGAVASGRASASAGTAAGVVFAKWARRTHPQQLTAPNAGLQNAGGFPQGRRSATNSAPGAAGGMNGQRLGGGGVWKRKRRGRGCRAAGGWEGTRWQRHTCACADRCGDGRWACVEWVGGRRGRESGGLAGRLGIEEEGVSRLARASLVKEALRGGTPKRLASPPPLFLPNAKRSREYTAVCVSGECWF